jgi:hypothetical protein
MSAGCDDDKVSHQVWQLAGQPEQVAHIVIRGRGGELDLDCYQSAVTPFNDEINLALASCRAQMPNLSI